MPFSVYENKGENMSKPKRKNNRKNMFLTNNFRNIRIKRDLSIKTLAEAIGMTESNLHLIETHKVCTTVDTVIKAALLLDCTTDELLGMDNLRN